MEAKNEFDWYEITPADVEGKAWMDTEIPFGRLPRRAIAILPPYSQSHSPTGMCVFFDSDTTRIQVRYELGTPQMGEANFNETAFAGVDLYAFDDEETKNWRWASATPHFVLKAGNQKPEYQLIGGMPRKARRYRLYFPFRNQMIRFWIGVEKGAAFRKRAPRREKPLVYYGTSIIHGAFAIRPGLGIAEILGRELDVPVVNLGLSGAARMEPEMAKFLAEIDAGMYLVDPYHNSSVESVRANTEKFIETLCAARPGTAVFMLGAPHVVNSWLFPEVRKEQESKTALYARLCRKMAEKFANVHYIDGRGFYGSEEVSMDGTHPNDAAFAHMSRVLVRKIRGVFATDSAKKADAE